MQIDGHDTADAADHRVAPRKDAAVDGTIADCHDPFRVRRHRLTPQPRDDVRAARDCGKFRPLTRSNGAPAGLARGLHSLKQIEIVLVAIRRQIEIARHTFEPLVEDRLLV